MKFTIVMSEEPIWNRDPAASGWRSRAFLKNGEVFVYDDGRWFICLKGAITECASGREANAELSKARALLVYAALTHPLSEG